MRQKRTVGLVIAIIILFATMCMLYPNNTYAANSSYILGITNIRKSGYGYGVGDSTPEKKVWKIVSYNNSSINYDNAFYCIKAEHGFVDNTDNANTDVSTIRKNYDNKIDMKQASASVIAKLNAINASVGDTAISQATYNKILWIMDNMYLPNATSAATDKATLAQAAGINSGNLLLTDDELEVIQQLAIWHYTNPTDTNYNTATTIYRNRIASQDNNYASLADIFDNPSAGTQAGRVRQLQADAIYNYLVNTAEQHANYLSEAVNTLPATLDNSTFKAVRENDRVIVGPLKVTIDTSRARNVEILFKDENGTTITLTGDNKLLNQNKEVVSSGNVLDVVGQNFYISLPENTTIKKVGFSLKYSYATTTSTYYTTSQSTYLQEQPVVLVERGNITNTLNAETTISDKPDEPHEPVDIDLALRKFITSVNSKGVEREITNRIPQVDTSTINTTTGGTATYNHTKKPVSVKIGDIVTYTIRVYNEGKVNGYVSEITDHLPSYLEILQKSNAVTAEEKAAATFNENFLWEISADGRIIKTQVTASDKSDTYSVLTGIQRENTLLQAFKGGTKLDYIDVKVKCKVKSNVESGTKITNIADITKMQDETGKNITVDRDSQVANVQLPSDSELPNYKDTEINSGITYIPGQQDDDDFEKLIIQVFDLALRKFITAINDQSVTTRVPVPTIDKTGNIKYNHDKTPLVVQTGNVVTYTLRIYNEGDIAGYASEITDDLPEGLEFLPNNDINKTYHWKMIDKDGKETTDLTKAVKVTTDYLSKEQEKTAGKNLIKAYDASKGITSSNPDHRDIKIAFKVIEPNTSDKILTNIAQISGDSDSDGNEIDDIDSIPGNDKMDEDDIDIEHVRLGYFDLALRKFITKVNNQDINYRYPKLTLDENGKIKYNHPKEPVEVENGNIVTYTIRVYNEGRMAGYATEVTDNLPEGLEFLPNNDINKTYRWKMIDKDGKETTDLTKAVKVTTDYLSKEQETTEGANLIKAYDASKGITDTNPDYKDVKIAFKVIEPNTSNRILINTAEISEDSDSNGNPVDDVDSTPSNNNDGEDDIDIEKVKVVEEAKYFDLALRKFITKVDNLDISYRYPNLTLDENGKIKYSHTKEPVKVQNGNVVTYTLRIYNEGDIDGYATEVTDNLPEGLEYLPNNDLNKTYRWKMIDKDGKETTDLTKAVKITTDYLSKEQEKTAGANLIKAYDASKGITDTNPDYRDIKIAFKVIEPNTSNRILINTAEISEDSDSNGKPVYDIDSTPGNNKDVEDDIDIEKVKVEANVEYFDLALRKFITKVDNLDVNNRYPKLSIDKNGKIKYTHTKEPVEVENGNIVTYTIRVYNEGQMAGYATEVTDNLPKGLEYLPNNDLNKTYRWKMIDKDGKETTDLTKAVKITTDYLSKEQEKTAGANLIKAFNKEAGITDKNPDYKDIEIAFKVTEPNTSDRILINTAEISNDSDSNGNPVDDIDSIPGNNKNGEDDIDIEKVKVKYFDLALKKWVTQVYTIENGKQTVTNTGHTGNENPEPVVKVDLKSKKVKSVTVKFGYKIKVTNEGQIEGYAKEVKDYIPDGLKFVAKDNPTWTKVSDKEVVTNKLANTLLKPGQSATVDIILTWENAESNLGLKVNIAEISKDYNKSNTPDIDSTPNNKKNGEDDIDDAPVILSIKTGEIRVYVVLTSIVLVTLVGGVILIKKYVL